MARNVLKCIESVFVSSLAAQMAGHDFHISHEKLSRTVLSIASNIKQRPRCGNSSRCNARRHRRAGVVLELLLSFPILLIAFLAAIEFGMLFSKIQQLALASRVGAIAASQSIFLTPVNGPVPPSILLPISRQMNL